jgi:hypothetical protein
VKNSAAVWWPVLLLFSVFSVGQETKPSKDPWAPWQFLIGEWSAEGGGKPGQATSGGFSFATQLEGKVLVRKSWSDYPASGNRPAYHHEDLMIVYPDSAGKPARAVYFDNEGHVINYGAELSSDGDLITLVSEPVASQPRFRLTYKKSQVDAVAMKFEIAPPGKPEAFSTYVEGSSHRKGNP